MYDFDTLAVHAGEEADPETGALRLPLHMATTFKLPPFGVKLFDALMMESRAPAARLHTLEQPDPARPGRPAGWRSKPPAARRRRTITLPS